MTVKNQETDEKSTAQGVEVEPMVRHHNRYKLKHRTNAVYDWIIIEKSSNNIIAKVRSRAIGYKITRLLNYTYDKI